MGKAHVAHWSFSVATQMPGMHSTPIIIIIIIIIFLFLSLISSSDTNKRHFGCVVTCHPSCGCACIQSGIQLPTTHDTNLYRWAVRTWHINLNPVCIGPMTEMIILDEVGGNPLRFMPESRHQTHLFSITFSRKADDCDCDVCGVMLVSAANSR